jgi:hypothetical protein
MRPAPATTSVSHSSSTSSTHRLFTLTYTSRQILISLQVAEYTSNFFLCAWGCVSSSLDTLLQKRPHPPLSLLQNDVMRNDQLVFSERGRGGERGSEVSHQPLYKCVQTTFSITEKNLRFVNLSLYLIVLGKFSFIFYLRRE